MAFNDAPLLLRWRLLGVRPGELQRTFYHIEIDIGLARLGLSGNRNI
jgi:hypothetical protein